MADKVTVIGAGAWGSALACVAARAGNETIIWGRSTSTIREINTNHTNEQYLPGLKIEESITATIDLEVALEGSQLVLLSLPTQQLSSKLFALKEHVGSAILVTTCKGIDQKSGKLPAEIIREAFPNNHVAALSGPSFASDVVRGLPTAVTIACSSAELGDGLSKVLSTNTFRCYAATDIQGVELGGALKNVLAVAVGIARGLGLGASAEAALMARGFAELRRLAIALGAQAETLSGLSGFGDLVLTCSSTQSRNFSYGHALGKGENLEGLKLAEGAHTASIALKIAETNKIDTPIIREVVNVLEKKSTPSEAVMKLLSRPLKRET